MSLSLIKNYVLTKELATKIDLILAAHENDGSQLVGILLDIQELIPNHYIPEEIAYYLAEKLDVKITNIYDCITFYSSLSTTPRAKYPIQICNSIVCKVNQNDTIFTTLKELLGIDLNEVTYDGRFTLESVTCFGACDMAPAVRINGKVYGYLTSRAKIENLLTELI
ncbi:NADH-quinone oxidoreductase subunit NuoE family protein [Propionispira raffinosivorans]|uniref:NADH-quinone oxidoreductase subunit NuoE family protein n=1 Tax=Propionispira raffinosivorans TaxID=86959 RepID=UPI00036B91E0|nr:NAD(P)H-dependent oxidoreductase subunit E [Propionispira raffinosivorans]